MNKTSEEVAKEAMIYLGQKSTLDVLQQAFTGVFPSSPYATQSTTKLHQTTGRARTSSMSEELIAISQASQQPDTQQANKEISASDTK